MDYNRAITATQVVGQKRQVTDGLGNLFVYGSDELGRLIEVTQPVVKGQTPVMAYIYDPADNLLTATGPNNAVMTTQPDGTIIYTPFPDYELTDPPTGADTVRTTYRLAGQIVAVQTKVGAAGTFYFTYTDHLGNISAMSTIAGVYVADSRAWYDPFGTFISDPTANPPDVTPVPSSNPSISNHGFTGHRHNNTGTNNLGLIYMNARYYLPEIGRFISADTIVPEPKDPQTYNRYSYALNSPTNFTDPTGHCTSNYEAGSQGLQTCLDGWNAVVNYLAGAAFGPGGSGNFPNEMVSDWLVNADIGTLENLMQSYGIDYGYVYTPPVNYSGLTPRKAGSRGEICQYWQSCYDPVAEYSVIGGNLPLILPVGPTFIWDQWGNIYFSITAAPTRGVGIYAGNVKIKDEGEWKNIEDLAVDRQEKAVEDFLTGWGDGGYAAMGVGGCLTGNSTGNYALQMGFATPGASPYLGYTWLIYDK